MEARITAVRTNENTEVKVQGHGGNLLDLTEEIVASVVVAVAEATGEDSDVILNTLFDYIESSVERKQKEREGKGTTMSGTLDEVEEMLKERDDVPEDVREAVQELRKVADIENEVAELKKRAENASGKELLDVLSDAVAFARKLKKDDTKTA